MSKTIFNHIATIGWITLVTVSTGVSCFGQSESPFGQAAPRWSQAPTATTVSGFGSVNLLSGQNRFLSEFDAESMKINNELSQQVAEIVKKIRESETDDEKAELKNEVQQILEQQYDLYLETQEKPLKQLEARLEKLRTEFEKRKSAKEELVKLRLDTLWYDAIGMSWPGGSGRNRFFGQAVTPYGLSVRRPAQLSEPAAKPEAPARVRSSRTSR